MRIDALEKLASEDGSYGIDFMAAYKKELTRQKRIRALKNALLCAAIGGAGGAVLSRGDIPSTITSAAASGIGTYLLNRF